MPSDRSRSIKSKYNVCEVETKSVFTISVGQVDHICIYISSPIARDRILSHFIFQNLKNLYTYFATPD